MTYFSENWNRMAFWKSVSDLYKCIIFGIIYSWEMGIAVHMQPYNKADHMVQWYSYKKCVRIMCQPGNKVAI